MHKWIMIVNPASASATTKDTWQQSKKILEDGGLAVETWITDYPSHGIKLAQEAAARGERYFIAVGGDGTIHEVMTGLLRYTEATGGDMGDFTLAVLPYGTGNDWIKTSLIPRDMAAAAQCILAGKTSCEDVVRVTFENGVFCMANVGGIGLDADICHYTNSMKEKKLKGGLLYKMVAPYSIFTKNRYPVEIICDGECIYKGKLFSVVIGNGDYRGGGVHQTEEGDWSDGILEVSVMGAVSHMKGLKLMLHALSGDFSKQKGIISRRFRKLTVRLLDHSHRVELDGETPGMLPVTFEVTGQQIQIIVP